MDRHQRVEALKLRALGARARLDREARDQEAAKESERVARQEIMDKAANFVRSFDQAVGRLNAELSSSGFKIETDKEVKIARVGSIEERQAKLAVPGDPGAYRVLAFAFHRTNQVFVQYYGSVPINFTQATVSHADATEEWIEDAIIAFCDACLPEA